MLKKRRLSGQLCSILQRPRSFSTPNTLDPPKQHTAGHLASVQQIGKQHASGVCARVAASGSKLVDC